MSEIIRYKAKIKEVTEIEYKKVITKKRVVIVEELSKDGLIIELQSFLNKYL